VDYGVAGSRNRGGECAQTLLIREGGTMVRSRSRGLVREMLLFLPAERFSPARAQPGCSDSNTNTPTRE
jgi:hypothetical protein